MGNAKYAITKTDKQEILYKITDGKGWSKYMSQEAALKISEIMSEYEEQVLSQAIILTRNSEHILASDIIAAKEMIDKRKTKEWKHKAAYITGAPLVTIFFKVLSINYSSPQ